MNTDNRYDNEIKPLELIKVIFDEKILLVFLTCLFFVGSVAYSLLAEEKWISYTILEISKKPTSGSSSGGIGSSAISSFVGINSTDKSDSPRAAILLKSKDLVKRLIEKEDVLANMFAFKSYNKQTGKSIYNNEIYDADNKVWIQSKPTYIEAHRKYNRMLSIDIDKFTGFITVTVKHGSPKFANQFLNIVIDELNNHAREREIKETEKALAYLYEKIDETFQDNVRLSISSLIENQLKKQMFANVTKNFLLDPLDAPFEPDLRHSPQRTKIVVLGTLLGFFASIIFILLRYFLRSQPS
jgi:capsule polysaccharide export protein KpsE/RkpR